MGAELARKRAGKGTETGMSETQLREFASKPLRRKRKKKGNPGFSMPKKDAGGYY